MHSELTTGTVLGQALDHEASHDQMFDEPHMHVPQYARD